MPATTGDDHDTRSRTICDVQRVEFTVEPFVEGNPGRHVTEPLAALRAIGIDVDFGPLGSGCVTSSDRAGDVVAAIVSAALANGATHVNIDVAAIDDASESGSGQ